MIAETTAEQWPESYVEHVDGSSGEIPYLFPPFQLSPRAEAEAPNERAHTKHQLWSGVTQRCGEVKVLLIDYTCQEETDAPRE